MRNINTSSSNNASVTNSNRSSLNGTSSFLSRDPTKLAVIPSTQNPHVKGAIRSVKFAQSAGIDMLGFTEHVSYLNLVDARTFDTSTRQSIYLGTTSDSSTDSNSPTAAIGRPDVHVCGFSFSPDGRGIYAATETNIIEFDVDTMARRSFPVGALI